MPVNPSFKEADIEVADDFGNDFDINARPEQSTSTAVGAGWGDAEKLSTPSGDFPVDFKHTETPQVIKILDPNGPFATYKQHFLSQKTSGKRSYVCLGSGCPLCTMLNHKAEDKYAFNIVNLSADGGSQLQILTATPRLFKTFHAAHFSPQGPLEKNFWALSRSGVKQTTVYHFNAVKGRDLQEDWNINEGNAMSFIGAVQLYDRAVIRENSVAELTEIAQDILS